jgi:hypothetical protein
MGFAEYRGGYLCSKTGCFIAYTSYSFRIWRLLTGRLSALDYLELAPNHPYGQVSSFLKNELLSKSKLSNRSMSVRVRDAPCVSWGYPQSSRLKTYPFESGVPRFWYKLVVEVPVPVPVEATTPELPWDLQNIAVVTSVARLHSVNKIHFKQTIKQ